MQLRKNLEAQQINLRFYKDQLKPTLNAVVDYGLTALGGVQVQREPRPTTRSSRARSSARPSSDSAACWATCSGSTSHTGRSARCSASARAQHAESAAGSGRLQYTQSELALRSQELSVATEVRSVGRNVNTNRRRVDSTRAARILTERQLEAAQKKFSVGLATSLDVLVGPARPHQRAQQRAARRSSTTCKSLVDFEAVQDAGTGGAGATADGVDAAGDDGQDSNNRRPQTGSQTARLTEVPDRSGTPDVGPPDPACAPPA